MESLPKAVSAMDRFGFDTLRIFLGGKFDYLHPEYSPDRFTESVGPMTLTRISRLPRYRALFEKTNIHTVWLTAYPVFDYGNGPVEIDLHGDVPSTNYSEDGRQMLELVETLYRSYGSQDRIILISNNETDEKLREVGSAFNVAHNLSMRMNAVQHVRDKYRKSKLKILFGPEIKYWRLALPDGSRALDTVLPKMQYDFVSFSAWEAVSHPEILPDALEDIAKRTRANVTAEGRAVFGERHVLVGEFGIAREWKIPATPIVNAFLDAVRSRRTPYAVYWQLYDNQSGETKQFGLLDLRDMLTPVGKLFEAIRERKP